MKHVLILYKCKQNLRNLRINKKQYLTCIPFSISSSKSKSLSFPLSSPSSSMPLVVSPSLFLLSASPSSSSSPLTDWFPFPFISSFLGWTPFVTPPFTSSSLFTSELKAAAPFVAAFISHRSYPNALFLLLFIFSSASSKVSCLYCATLLKLYLRRHKKTVKDALIQLRVLV